MTNSNYTKGVNKHSGKSRKVPETADFGDEEIKVDPALVRAKREMLRLLDDEYSNAYFGKTKAEEGTAEEVEKKIAEWALNNGLDFFGNFNPFMAASKVGIYKNLEHDKRIEFFMKIPEHDTMSAEVQQYTHPLVAEYLKNLQDEGAITAPLNADGSHILVADPKNRAIYDSTLKVQVNGDAEVETLTVSDSDFMIKAIPENVKIYNPTLPGKARKVEFDAISGINSSRIHIGPSTDKDAVSTLEQLGLVMDKTHAMDTFRQAIAAYVESGKAEQLTGMDTPGFYKNPHTNGIFSIGYRLREVSREELKTALNALNRISGEFPKSLKRFSVVVKHSLSAPFSYYLRQQKIYPQHLMFYGITGTSKTALMLMNHGIWGLWDPESSNHGFFISGAEADTPSRIGERLEQGTFTVIVDEGEGLFLKSDGRENVPVIGILKHAMQSLVSRQTSDRGAFQALASIAIASNVKPPKGAAPILSRMATYESGSNEQIHASLAEKEKFQKLENELYPQLEPIGQYVASKVLANPEILTSDFEAFGESILREMYAFAGLDVPEFVGLHAEPTSIEDLDRDIREEIRTFLYRSNLDAHSRNIGRTGILKTSAGGNEYPDYDDRTNVPAAEKIEVAIKSGLVPWQIFKDTKGVQQVILTTAFAKEISKIAGEAYNLQSIGELLGFEVKLSRINSGPVWSIITDFENYIKFIVPHMEDSRSKNSEMEALKATESSMVKEKKEKIEGPWKSSENSTNQETPIPEESKDKTDKESGEGITETKTADNVSMDPVLKHLIDCTFNSSKKFKTVHELFRERPQTIDWSEAFIYKHLEEEVSKGTVVRKGIGYGYRDIVEGSS
ncbi:MAG: hypothetical protein M1468_01110 [Candidatus Thermoplasmatota archaeon]|jgi:hypothetical protein|nr:hypothetical protein [Candidatus Thermoplasmatota archaeon]MCL5441248.1 hypothetical protein [Candidatus Thermoplasmatota archaeon]